MMVALFHRIKLWGLRKQYQRQENREFKKWKKKHFIFLIGIWFFVTSNAMSQEPELNIYFDPAQDFFIKWDGWQALQNVVPTSVEIVDGEVGSHVPLAVFGNHTWEAATPDSTEAAPKKVVFAVEITGIPAGAIRYWWGGAYTISVRGRADMDGNTTVGAKSEESDKLYVVSLGPFGRPMQVGQ